jgi:AraC-like DNA-binding protein
MRDGDDDLAELGVRLQVAVRLVARRGGYASEFAFAKAFKREYGMSPGRYRRERPPIGIKHSVLIE